MIKCIVNNQSMSISEIASVVRHEFTDLTISEEHIRRILRANNITRKRTSKRHYPLTRRGKPVSLDNELKSFYSIVQTFALNKLIY
jgi:hypothetical protein